MNLLENGFPVLDYYFQYQESLSPSFSVSPHPPPHYSLLASLNLFNQPELWQLSLSQGARGNPEAAKFCTTATYSLGFRLERTNVGEINSSAVIKSQMLGVGVGWRGLAPMPPATYWSSIILLHSLLLSKNRQWRRGVLI